MTDKMQRGPIHTAPAGNVRFRGATSGQEYDVSFCGAPSQEALKLAKFVSRLAYRQHQNVLRRRFVRRTRSHGGGETVEPVKSFSVRWFRPDGSGRRGFAQEDALWIAVSTELRDEPLVRTILHEARHVVQGEAKHLHRASETAVAEADATGYADRWAAAFVRAYRLARGETSRVHFRKGRPPFGAGFPRGSVVISSATNKCYHYNPFNAGNAWT